MRTVPIGSLPTTNGRVFEIDAQEAVIAFVNCSASECPDYGADEAVAKLHIAGCQECQTYLMLREQEKRAMN